MKKKLANEKPLVVSYLTLRKAIGIIGTGLPFVLSLGAWLIFQRGIQDSISAYYYTGMRNVLVGALCSIGVFLLSYKGYEHADDIAGNLGCIFAVGVALFPTTPANAPSSTERIVGTFHLIFAASFFLTLIYFSLFQFTKTNPNKRPTRRKKQRNNVYRACGYTMAGCILLICIYLLLPSATEASLDGYKPLYWLETISILAFGVSWLTKGEALLRDG